MPRGGRRPGAGRPRIPYASQGIASRVLRKAGELARWMGLLDAKDERLRFEVLRYLTDKRDGKAAQSVIQTDTRESVQAIPLGDDFPAPFTEKPKTDPPSTSPRVDEKAPVPAEPRVAAYAETSGTDVEEPEDNTAAQLHRLALPPGQQNRSKRRGGRWRPGRLQ